MREVKGRFAPTPSGSMHIGNAFCYLLAWLSVRVQGGGVVLRFEDADVLRMRPDAVEETLSELTWLGLSWDEGPAPGERNGMYFQSCRTEIYDAWFEHLRALGEVYPCFCSRQDLRLAAAPHAEDRAPIYPGTCRGLAAAEAAALSRRRPPAWRLHVRDRELCFFDGLRGEQRVSLARDCGDFPIRRADGVYCYQFITALDDALMGVSEVVRSADLLSSTPWQIEVQQRLGLDVPAFFHIPMLLDEEGRRMAKRDFSLSVRELRARYSPAQVVGRLAFLAGLIDRPEDAMPAELLPLFSWDRLPTDDITLPPGLFS